MVGQMRCGDMYEEDVLKDFHACAISRHQYVPWSHHHSPSQLAAWLAIFCLAEPESLTIIEGPY